MAVVMVATTSVCDNCGFSVYSTWHDGWPAPKWWHHSFTTETCPVNWARGNKRANPRFVLSSWIKGIPW